MLPRRQRQLGRCLIEFESLGAAITRARDAASLLKDVEQTRQEKIDQESADEGRDRRTRETTALHSRRTEGEGEERRVARNKMTPAQTYPNEFGVNRELLADQA